MTTEAKCPVSGGARRHSVAGATTNAGWWPEQLQLGVLHQRSSLSDPTGGAFDYAKESRSLDLAAVKKDLLALMTDSQDWWPADFRALRALFHSHGVAQRRYVSRR